MISVRAMILAMAALTVACLSPSSPCAPRASSAARERRTAADVPGGIPLIAGSSYFQYLAALVTGAAFLDTLVDYAFNATAARQIGPGRPMMAFFSAFHATTGVVTLGVQAALTRWSLARLGLGRHVGRAAGDGGRGRPDGAVVRLARQSSSSSAARTPCSATRCSGPRTSSCTRRCPASRKRLAKPLIDVGCDRLGTIAGNATMLIDARDRRQGGDGDARRPASWPG